MCALLFRDRLTLVPKHIQDIQNVQQHTNMDRLCLLSQEVFLYIHHALLFHNQKYKETRYTTIPNA
jgi:hypothetical protein